MRVAFRTGTLNKKIVRDVLIIGGGLAGLISARQLAAAGLQVLLIEKNNFPFHKVCGEYISNEVTPFLRSIDAFPEMLRPSAIRRLLLSSNSGRQAQMDLELGGFGISRYAFDHFLYRKALEAGVDFRLKTKVEKIILEGDHFAVSLAGGEKLNARLVIGAYGKRTRLDKQLQRKFIQKHSPYIGVKYHVKHDFPEDLIALHNFPGGYCGVCTIEDDTVNLCYLSTRENLKKCGNIQKMEKEVLCRNPHLKKIFEEAKFLYDRPRVINEVSFAPKEAVSGHVLMTGDAAGLITPLCGNGMAMAIHSSKVLSDLIIKHYQRPSFDRQRLEADYARLWDQLFYNRLRAGRLIQRLFGASFASDVTVAMAKNIKPFAKFMIRQTHGRPF